MKLTGWQRSLLDYSLNARVETITGPFKRWLTLRLLLSQAGRYSVCLKGLEGESSLLYFSYVQMHLSPLEEAGR